MIASEELELCVEHCGGVEVVLANLVSRFAYHCAEALGLPFAVVSPSIPPPSSAPSPATIRSLVPLELRRRLEQADREVRAGEPAVGSRHGRRR
jgi:hypothetical protein